MSKVLDDLGHRQEVTKTEVVSAFLKTIQRSLNCLSSEEQFSRKSALEKLHVCLVKDDGAGLLPPTDILQAAWDEVVLEKVLHCISDTIEKCRELAIQLIREVTLLLPEVDYTLTEIVQVMAKRMGQLPVVEESEEIRLLLFSLLIDTLLPQCKLSTLHTIIEPLHLIISVALHDHFHEVQKSVCSVLVITANRNLNVFGNKTGTILKALVPCLTHCHSRVRIAIFQAIDAMVYCGLTQTSISQDLVPGTKSLAFDHNSAIREQFFAGVANWLNYNKKTMSDKEIHECALANEIPRFHVQELLPLLLLGLTDDSLDIAISTYEKLESIGEFYKKVVNYLEERNNVAKSTPNNNFTQDNTLSKQIADGKLEVCGKEIKLGKSHLVQVLEDKNHVVETNCDNSREEEQTIKDTLTTHAIHGSCFQKYIAHPSELESMMLQGKTQSSNMESMDIIESRGSCDFKSDCGDFSKSIDGIRGFSEKASCIVIEPIKTNEEPIMEREKKGGNGLHALAYSVPQRHQIEVTRILCSKDADKKVMSEITEEGAIKKDNDERGDEILLLPKPYTTRPKAGCRLMVEAFLRPMLEAALNELKQWTTPTRLIAARLLHSLMVLAEGCAEENLDILIPTFCSAVGDDDVKVAKRVVSTIHIVGFYVPPDKWLSKVLKSLNNKKASQAQRANVLVVVAAFLYGTPRKDMEEKHVVKICDKLYDREICYSDHIAIQNQLLSVVANLIQVAGALCKSSSFNIFVLLLQLQSVEGNVQLQKRSHQVLEALAQVLGMESMQDLYIKHIHSMLDIVTVGHKGWSCGLPGKLVFQTFMRNAKDTVGPYLETLIPVFRACLQNDQDPSLRISFLQLLDELFERPGLGPSWTLLAPDVIGKLLIPCGVWRASKTEAAIRYGVMVAIGTFLRRGLCSQIHMQEIMSTSEGLLPIVKTCLDEDYFLDVRRAATHVLYQFLRVYGPFLSDEQRIKLIKVLTKRMDDSSNNIRLAILPSVAMFFTTMPPSFSDFEVKEFILFLVAHMDDKYQDIQEGTCRALEACAWQKPHVILEVLQNICSQYKSQQYIEQVLKAIDCAKNKSA